MVVPWIKHTQTVFSFIMVIDIIFTFFTAFEKEMRIEFDSQEIEENKKISNKVHDSSF